MQALSTFGGPLNVRVEVDTPFIDSVTFGVWGESTWGEAEWAATDPEWTDITEFCLEFTSSAGRQRWDERFTAASATLLLDNSEGIFTPSSDRPPPFHLPFRPGRRVRIITIIDAGLGPVKVPIFTGRVDSAFDLYADAGFDVTTLLPLTDDAALWADNNPLALSTATGIQSTDARVDAALDRLTTPWPIDRRDIAAGAHTMQTSFLAQPTLEECQRAAEAEGGAFYASPAGRATFRHRDWLLEAFSTEIGEAVDPGLTSPRGLAVTGRGLWTYSAGNLIRLAPADGSTVQTVASPVADPAAGGWGYAGAGVLIIPDTTAETLTRVDEVTGAALSTHSPAFTAAPVAAAVTDLADPNTVHVLTAAGVIDVVELNSDTVVESLTVTVPAATVGPAFGWNGSALYVGSSTDPAVFRLDLLTGSAESTVPVPAPVEALAYAGPGDLADYWYSLDAGSVHRYRLSDRTVTVQAVLGGSGGSGLILDARPSWESALVRNAVEFARVGGHVQSVQDLDSISLSAGLRSYRRLDFLNASDADVLALAERVLATYAESRMRLDSVTITPPDDPDLESLRLFWDARFGDLVTVTIETGRGWGYSTRSQIMGVDHRITSDDWTVTLRLDDALARVTGRSALVESLTPTAWWRFTEDAGTVTADETAGGHDIDWTSALGTFTPVGAGGPRGQGLGILDGIVSGNPADDAGIDSETLTLEAWFRPLSSGYLYSSAAAAGSTRLEVFYDADLERIVAYPSTANNVGTATPVGSAPLGEWIHYVARINTGSASRSLDQFINGELARSFTSSFTPAPATQTIRIGRRAWAGDNIETEIAELVVYDAALNGRTIRDLFIATD